MTDSGKKYRVLRDGLHQVVDGDLAARKVGALIALSEVSATPLLAEGWVEEDATEATPSVPAKRGRRSQESAE